MLRSSWRIRRKWKLAILRKRELNQMLPEERRKKVTELREELTSIRTSVKSGGTVENQARIRELRKKIDRLLKVDNYPKKKTKESAKTHDHRQEYQRSRMTRTQGKNNKINRIKLS